MSVYYKENPAWLEASIESMLHQTVRPNEFLIIEDGPLTEGLYAVILKYKIRYPEVLKIIKFETNRGLGKALEVGVRECKGPFIARMDSDDIAIPTRIEQQLEIFNQDEEIDIVGGAVSEFIGTVDNQVAVIKMPQQHKEIYKFAKKRCPFRHPTIMFKKEAVVESGNYRKFTLFEDYDLYIRMLMNGCKGYNIEKILCHMRVNNDFYNRRGGLHYAKCIFKFKTYQLKNGFYKFHEYLFTLLPHLMVCILPNSVRKVIYNNLLRDKPKTKKEML